MHSSTVLLMDVQVSAVDPDPQVCLKHDSVSQSQTIQLQQKPLLMSYKHGGKAEITVFLDAVSCRPRELCR